MRQRPHPPSGKGPAETPLNGRADGARAQERAGSPDGPVSSYEPGFGLPDQKLLGELSHELGNYFHKIYYWLEYLRGHASGEEESEVPLRMLEDTVEGLEGFSRMALEYFAPARLSFTKLSLGEVFAATTPWLGGRRLEIEGLRDWRDVVVFADPAGLQHVLRAVVGWVNRTLVREDEIRVRLLESRRDEFEGIEIGFVVGDGAESLPAPTSGIEMTVAEKFLKVHGGELFAHESDGVRLLGIFLPLYP